jgi:hypothetical protein
MFLHTVLFMIILQTTFLYVYHLKDDIRFCLKGSPNSHIYACVFQRWPCLQLLLHVHKRQPSALWVVGSSSLMTLLFLQVHEL